MSESFIKIAKRIIKEHPEYFDALAEFDKTGKLPDITNPKVKQILLKKYNRNT